MKKYVIKGISALRLTFISLSLSSQAQDLVVTTTEDSLNVSIVNVTDERMDVRMKSSGKRILSVPNGGVSGYIIGYYDKKMGLTEGKIDTTRFCVVEMINGNVYSGKILRRTDDLLVLQTKELGDISLKLLEIKKVRYFDEEVTDENYRWFDYLQSSRYFYSPSGYGLKKGDAYYQNVWILFNQYAMGITDNFSVGVGLVPLFLFDGTATPVWVTPKVSFPVVENKVNLGAGALIGGVIGDVDNAAFGVLYGIATIGSRDRNISFGVGYGYAKSEYEEGGGFSERATFSLSGMLKVGRNFYLQTENYLFHEHEVALFSLGGRSLIKSVTLDYGLVIPNELSVAIPWLGLVVPIETGLKRN